MVYVVRTRGLPQPKTYFDSPLDRPEFPSKPISRTQTVNILALNRFRTHNITKNAATFERNCTDPQSTPQNLCRETPLVWRVFFRRTALVCIKWFCLFIYYIFRITAHGMHWCDLKTYMQFEFCEFHFCCTVLTQISKHIYMLCQPAKI